MSPLLPLLICLAVAPPDDESFLSLVRTSEPLSAEQQRATFHLPEGFEIQLFAAEPDLQKPMNMAFDAAGRLWVSGSVEYPYAAAEGQGQDTIKVLADTDGDGRADRFTTFVDGLNIPIGLYPFRDGVIAYSIPNIWFFRDTDGDGKADRREILYGPLGEPRDTHGMQNAFRRGFDGWLYINHGFANESTISGSDGSRITLQSGNTYRVRLDGSRVEQFTWGQVNPFGSTFLPNGDLITADCHSRPLTLLQRGAYYPSFGKPHDGLGFAPDLMEHSHGSTAIAGAAYYTGDNFPPEYHGRLFTGNVMTSRVNQDQIRYHGATPRAEELRDFLAADDPWFRPVDLQVGPDGALYIADFYNRIIGHYEVALDHPGRDRHRARIWRVVYRGEPTARAVAPDLSRAGPEQLLDTLAHPSLPLRMLATDQLSDRIGEAAVDMLVGKGIPHDNPWVRIHAMWVLHRLGKLEKATVRQLSADASEPVRIHAMRVLVESPQWNLDLSKKWDQESSPHVRRAAAEAAVLQVPFAVREWLDILARTPADDLLLRHAIRLSIRDHLRNSTAWLKVREPPLSAAQHSELMSIALAVPSRESAEYLFQRLRSPGETETTTPLIENQLQHIFLYLPEEKLGGVADLARQQARNHLERETQFLLLLVSRLGHRKGGELESIHRWGAELAQKLLSQETEASAAWRSENGLDAWGLEPRQCEDGQRGVPFLSSLPGGEQSTSVLHSARFVIPPRLSFYLCGHLGFPDKPAIEQNLVRLRRADTGEVIQQVLPPRNDTARRVEWDLSAHADQPGVLEIVDGLDLPAYAWLAVARFEPPVVTMPALSPKKQAESHVAACRIISSLGIESLRPSVTRLTADEAQPWRVRSAAIEAELSFSDRPVLSALASVVGEPAVDTRVRNAICRFVIESRADAPEVLQTDVMRSTPARVQRQVADALASTPVGATALVTLVEQGYAAARLLQDPTISRKLAALKAPGLSRRVSLLTERLPSANLELQRLVEQRRRVLSESRTDVVRGQEHFRKHCANCHQVAGQGTLVGPQLDGIGIRGAERLIEDILDPHRNVDAAFHMTTLVLSNGKVVPGLVRRDEGTTMVLANQEGKEFSISKAEIDEISKSNHSLMPANFGEVIPPQDFNDLVSYLLTLRPAE